jgi:hypothetical protein
MNDSMDLQMALCDSHPDDDGVWAGFAQGKSELARSSACGEALGQLVSGQSFLRFGWLFHFNV